MRGFDADHGGAGPATPFQRPLAWRDRPPTARKTMADASCRSMTQVKPRDTKGLEQGANPLEVRKDRARAWFETLRDRMVSALEAVEDEAEGSPLYKGLAPG